MNSNSTIQPPNIEQVGKGAKRSAPPLQRKRDHHHFLESHTGPGLYKNKLLPIAGKGATLERGRAALCSFPNCSIFGG